MNSVEFIHAKLKRVNQILKESGPRGGEAKEQRTAETTKLLAGKKDLPEEVQAAGVETISDAFATEATEDWFIALHKGLWDLAE